MIPHERVQGKRFSILGAARSGVAVAKLLKAHGALPFVSEKSSEDDVRGSLDVLIGQNIPFETGGHTANIFTADVLVLSPGVPSQLPAVQEARQKGLKIVSELEVASWFCPGPIIAVTGTNGKTTTTSLLGRMFGDARAGSIVAGNIGTAFSETVGTMTQQTTAILEVSSFQLDHLETFRPKVAVLLNITPDHLDRYEHSFERYIDSKCRVFKNQGNGDTIVYNGDDEVTRTAVEKRIDDRVKRLPFSITHPLEEGAFLEDERVVLRIGGERYDLIGREDISIRGNHNLYNAMAASLAAKTMSISTGSLRATLRNFKGVEHRLEFVRTLAGVNYINDSKATNVDSVWYALQSFDSPIVVMLGGRDKGNDYSRLYPLARKHVKAVVAIGESAQKVVDAFSPLVPVKQAETMVEAVKYARNLASPGDTVLLSPACASFDWFENYEHRGRVFKEIVNTMT